MKILHLIDALDYSGSARQIHLLGPVFARENVTVEVCCLGRAGAWVESLRRMGVTVHTLDWTRWFDPSVLWNLREILDCFAPDLIHVWRLPALRALAVVARDSLPRTVMSAPLPPKGRLPWWDRKLLERVRCLAVAGVSDQQRCLTQGIVAPPLRVVRPAVADRQVTIPKKQPWSIACIGKMEYEEGLRQAVWAFDFLHHMYRDGRLKLVGTGSQEESLRRLAVGMGSAPQVEFLGEQTDTAELLESAEIVWIPSTANCGRQVALEAMAAGCAVIASDVPCLRDVIIDGETGYLAPVDDLVQRARLTHRLFQNPTLRERIGQSARQHVARGYTVAEAAARWTDVYRSACA